MSRILNWRLLALVAIALVAAAGLLFLPLGDLLQEFLDWAKSLGFWGPVVVTAAYIPATVFLIPGTILSLGAGFLFGPVIGTIAVSIGSTLGAAAAFLCGRTVARGFIEKRLQKNPHFQALDQAVAVQGFKIVLLTRLSPVLPYTLLNYAFGLTRVRFRDFVLASWIGMLPGTILYVSLGSAAGALTDIVTGKMETTLAQRVLFGLGLAATIVVTVWVTRIARQALAQAVPPAAALPPSQEPAHAPDDANPPSRSV